MVSFAPRVCTRALGVMCLLVGCRVYPGSQMPVFPQRPTFSSDTRTAAPGTIEQETGMTIDPGDGFFTPTRLRYGSGPVTEVYVGWSPFNYVSSPSSPAEVGIGDFVFGVRHRLSEGGDRAAWAVQSEVKLPTASDTKGLGTGELDARFAAMSNSSWGDVTLTGYYELGFLGNSGSGIDLGFAAAAAGDKPFGDQVSLFTEVTGILVPEQDHTELFTIVGAAYRYSPSLVLDVSVLLGLEDAPDLQILVGVTQNIGRPLRGW